MDQSPFSTSFCKLDSLYFFLDVLRQMLNMEYKGGVPFFTADAVQTVFTMLFQRLSFLYRALCHKQRGSNMQTKQIGVVKDIIQAAGLRVSYSYDDLLFTEDNSVIFQFDSKNKKNLRFYVNKACDDSLSGRLEKRLDDSAKELDYTVTKSGEYEMEKRQGMDETEIRLLPF